MGGQPLDLYLVEPLIPYIKFTAARSCAMASSTQMDVDSPLVAVECSIQNVEEEIKAVCDQLQKEQDAEEKKYLRKKEERLRKKEEQLRKKEEQLREEKLLLLKFNAAPGVLTGGSGSAFDLGSLGKPAPPPVQVFWDNVRDAQFEEVEAEVEADLVTDAVSSKDPRTFGAGIRTYKRRKLPARLTAFATVFRLPDGVVFPGTQASKVMIRKVYKQFLDLAFEVLRRQKVEPVTGMQIDHLLITGTPGTGKTFFGYYLLYQLLMQPVFPDGAIVWEESSKGSPDCAYYYKGGVLRHGEPKNFDHLADGKTIFLVNGADPVLRAAHRLGTVILFSSTKDPRGSTWQFMKDAKKIVVYMPLWDLCELILAGAVQGRTQESVRAEYRKWGGSARSVLLQYGDEDYIRRFEHALQEARNKAELMYSVGSVLQAKDSSSFIIHMKVVDNACTRTITTFASSYVAKELERIKGRDDLCTMVEYVNKHLLVTDEAAVVGKRFEFLVHRLFTSSTIEHVKFKARKLGAEPRVQEEVRFQLCGDFRSFHKLEDIKAGSQGYFVPDYETYPCYDSLVLRQGGQSEALQVTLNLHHDAKFQYVDALYERNGLRRFYFVVPDKLFEKYPSQRLLHGSTAVDWPCEHWVLSIPKDFHNFHLDKKNDSG